MTETLRQTIDDDGVVTITFDDPGKPVNTFTRRVLEELEAVIEQLADDAGLTGVIFASAKPDAFVTGADLVEMSELDRDQMEAFLEQGQRVFNAVALLRAPTVAAINGNCLGGGFELALACDRRVAADRGRISIGLPEVNVGLLPAWGGTTRLTLTVGLRRALPLLAAGKTMPPRRALRAGLIDEVVRPEALPAAARRLLRSATKRRRPGWIDRSLVRVPGVANRMGAIALRKTLEQTFGNYPAPEKVIEVATVAARRWIAVSLAAERHAAMKLAETEACGNLMRLFHLRRDAKRRATEGVPPATVEQAAVVGGGTMGAGIAAALVRSGIPVRLIEVSPEAAGAALGRVHDILAADLKSKRAGRLEVDRAMHLISPTAHLDHRAGLGRADVVIEAVAERMEVKHSVFARLIELTRPDAVLATNTSSLSVAEIAASIDDPARRSAVIGLHFFNPVPRMPLVEVIAGPDSSAAAVSTGAALALRIGKTPVIAADSPGFLVNRVLIPYLAEALRAACEGHDIAQIDDAMKRWGMPMGPFELLDRVGLDVCADIFRSVGARLTGQAQMPEGFEQALARGWRGRKSGGGFYVYPAKRRRRGGDPKVNDEMLALLNPGRDPEADAPPIDREQMTWRLVLPMVTEAGRLLREGVCDSTEMLDLATVLGMGLAPFRGGLARYVDTAGSTHLVRKMEQLAREVDPRFAPDSAMSDLAETDGLLRELIPRPERPAAADPVRAPRAAG